MLGFTYILLTIIMILLYAQGFNSAKSKIESLAKRSAAKEVILPFAFWIAYVAILGYTGILKDVNLPPKFPIFLVLPLVLLFVYFYSKYKDDALIQAIPMRWTAYLQSFRIVVEVLILLTFYQGILPIEATFEGYNFDILLGVSALVVGFFITKEPRKYFKFLRAWNTLGILMVVFVAFIVASSLYKPDIWGHAYPTVSMRFLEMPYLLLPGFLAPLAIFTHVISFIQLRKYHDSNLEG